MWKSLKEHLSLATALSVPLSFMLTAMFIGFWSMLGLREVVRDELGVAKNNELIERNYELILDALGENTILKQPPFLSYVDEPIYRGEKVIVNLIVQKSAYGQNCNLEAARAVYVLPNTYSIPGGEIGPSFRIGRELTTVRLAIDPPSEEIIGGPPPLGRWTIYMIYEFDCDGRRVLEETIPLPFIMQKRP